MSSPASLIESSFALTQELTHVGSWQWQPSSGVVTWSDELYRIYGFEPGSRSITAEFFLSCVLPEDRPLVQQGISAALERGGTFRWSERIVRPDGSLRMLDTVGQVQGEGASRSLFGTCRDVTEERERSTQIRRAADIFDNVPIGLSVWDSAGHEQGSEFRLVASNPVAQRISGAELAGLPGRSFRELFPYAAGGEVESLLGLVAREQRAHESQVGRSGNPDNPNRALSLRGFPLPGGCVGLAVLDVTEQVVERRLQAAEQQVLEMVAASRPLGESLAALVLAVEEHSPPVIGSVLLLDHDGVHLRHGAAPRLPASYQESIDGSAIGPDAGSCGTAAFLKRAVFVSDIETDPHWVRYRELARAHGLRASWSTPILSTSQRVLGTFAFYYREPREPSEAERALAQRVARLAAIAIERRQMEDQLRDLSAHVEAALEAERTRIAREIHDDLGQSLTAIKMDIAWLVRRLRDRPELALGGIAEKLTTMSLFTDEVIQRVRSISSGLRPGVLDDLGLVPAIEWQAQVFEERTGTACVVRSNRPQLALEQEVATAAFRIFQEALTNVVRHAEASRVEVSVDVREHALALEVDDDGVGISAEALYSPKSLGLLGARERAQRLGGQISVQARQPRGTSFKLHIPIPARGAG